MIWAIAHYFSFFSIISSFYFFIGLSHLTYSLSWNPGQWCQDTAGQEHNMILQGHGFLHTKSEASDMIRLGTLPIFKCPGITIHWSWRYIPSCFQVEATPSMCLYDLYCMVYSLWCRIRCSSFKRRLLERISLTV